MQAQNKKVLAVGPTNKRAKELREMLGDENAMTLHKLLKMRIKNGVSVDSNTRRTNPLEGVDVVIIDEIFALPVKMLGKIKSNIIDKFPNLQVIATGDPFQSRVSDVCVQDIDGYYKNVVATMFSYGILLQINKRMATQKDCDELTDIKRALKDGKTDIPHVKNIKQVKEIIERHITEGKFTGQILCYYKDTSKYVSNLIQDAIRKHPKNQHKNWRYIEGMQLCEGQELINRVWWKAQGKVININDSFVVSRIYDYVELEENENGESIEIPQVGIEIVDDLTGTLYMVKQSHVKNFAYPYCVTIHSSQGDTYSDCPITLMDFDAYWITANDKYVALSRSNRIDNIRIYAGPSLRISDKKIKAIVSSRISGHRVADSRSGRGFEEEDYVDVDWVFATLNLQKMKCAHADCECELSLVESNNTSFSIDRKDNRFAHTKKNCVIACRKCNISRKELI